MGITVIEKSEPGRVRPDAKVALVLAGGAVTGGAFKLGGLKALEDCFVDRSVSDFDIYVGLSAGAFLAAPLANGVSTAELFETLDGASDLGEFRLRDFYSPNLEEMVEKPVAFVTDLVSWVPRLITDTLTEMPDLLARLREPAVACLEEPKQEHFEAFATELLSGWSVRQSFPFPLDYLPSGVFDNRRLESFIRAGFERRGLTNDFSELYRRRGKALYIAAVNLDTAERVIFGHDEGCAITISEAVQATTALPGFYRPARIDGVDYIDGGVRRTANIDVAIEHGAELVVAYNPFRPFSNPVIPGRPKGAYGAPLADHGMLAIVNQVFRSLLHSRLHLGLRQYREDVNFKGDIILIEPTDTDETFFQMFPLNFWARRHAAEHGYLSVTQSIDDEFDTLAPIFERYGIGVSRSGVDEGAQRIREAMNEERGRLRVAS